MPRLLPKAERSDRIDPYCLGPLRSSKILFPKSALFTNLAPRTSLLIIVLLLATIPYSLLSQRPFPPDGDKAGEDLRCYQRIIERIHAGESYYDAAGSELRTRGYPTSSVFNWRLPTLAWLMGQLPTLRTGRIFAVLLSFAALLVWIRVLVEESSLLRTLLGSPLLLGPLLYSLSTEAYLTHEFWAGTLIMLSLGAHARGWGMASLACGILALFLRELTLPFACLMAIGAYIEGRGREALFWFAGIIAFGLTLAFHGITVKNLLWDGKVVQEEGWVVLGGWPFILSTAQLHPYLLLAPPWVTAVLLPGLLLGLIGWRGPVGLRVKCTVGLYLLAYAFVGKPFNQLWGLMYTNIMPLGILYLPYSLRILWKSINKRRQNELLHCSKA